MHVGTFTHSSFAACDQVSPFDPMKFGAEVNIIHYNMRFRDYLRLIKNETSLEDFRKKAAMFPGLCMVTHVTHP